MVAGKLKAWRGRNLTQAGRVVLTKYVLSSQLVYLLTIINTSTEFLEDLDKLRKRFLWAGDNVLFGGKCKVNWPTVGRPLQLGGLGVLDLKSFARALWLQWLWQEQNQPDKPWAGLGTPCIETDKLLFAACTTTHVGDGSSISFWHTAWAKGRQPKDLAMNIYNTSRRPCVDQGLEFIYVRASQWGTCSSLLRYGLRCKRCTFSRGHRID